MRDFVVGDYIIYTLVEVHFIIKGIVVGLDEKCLTIDGDNGGFYKDYRNKFELDYEKIRNEKIDTILI